VVAKACLRWISLGKPCMNCWLDIIVPARNPGNKLDETVASLLAQTERGFAVVLSDNWSKAGTECLDAAKRELEKGGVVVRRVRPPFELGRVHHWNWAHGQAQAEWMKPLFVGDLLKPHYVERLRQRVESRPCAQVVRCEFEVREMGVSRTTNVPFSQDTLTPAEFLVHYPSKGNWIGGPVNLAYRRRAWEATGGYSVHLPALSDLDLNVKLILRGGLEIIHETLAAFQLHEQRFSHGIAKRRVIGCVELWLILCQSRTFCRSAGLPWPAFGVAGPMITQIKMQVWHPFKRYVKNLLIREAKS